MVSISFYLTDVTFKHKLNHKIYKFGSTYTKKNFNLNLYYYSYKLSWLKLILYKIIIFNNKFWKLSFKSLYMIKKRLIR